MNLKLWVYYYGSCVTLDCETHMCFAQLKEEAIIILRRDGVEEKTGESINPEDVYGYEIKRGMVDEV